MLKKVIIGEREVPVPIPIQDLAAAEEWLQEALVPKGAILTKIELNGIDQLDAEMAAKQAMALDAASTLRVQIESPWDLAIKTLDAVRDLAHAIENRMQALAVACWDSAGERESEGVRMTIHDTQLILDLIEHVNGILDYSHKDMAPVNGLAKLVVRPLGRLRTSFGNREWKECSHFLLNRIHPLLRELVLEAESLQLSILSTDRNDGSLQASIDAISL